MARKTDSREVAERRYWREADARILVDKCRKSGETVSAFARRHGIKGNRLARWARRLKESGTGPVAFHPVRLVESHRETGGGAPIEIRLVGGQRVCVSHGFLAEDLRRVLAVLAEAEGC